MFLPYNLPDQKLLQDHITPYGFCIWIPDQMYIVLGNSNSLQQSVHLAPIQNDNVILMQRPTGGQTVFLSPQMVVVSAIHNTTQQASSKTYFAIYTHAIVKALESFGIRNTQVQGISDITFNGRKIAGSAMYRNQKRVFFHAVLNVSENSEILERYLLQPSTVPAYRQGRNHREFVTSLMEQGFAISLDQMIAALEIQFQQIPDQLHSKNS